MNSGQSLFVPEVNIVQFFSACDIGAASVWILNDPQRLMCNVLDPRVVLLRGGATFKRWGLVAGVPLKGTL
jgi:hypothetical protein